MGEGDSGNGLALMLKFLSVSNMENSNSSYGRLSARSCVTSLKKRKKEIKVKK